MSAFLAWSQVICLFCWLVPATLLSWVTWHSYIIRVTRSQYRRVASSNIHLGGAPPHPLPRAGTHLVQAAARALPGVVPHEGEYAADLLQHNTAVLQFRITPVPTWLVSTYLQATPRTPDPAAVALHGRLSPDTRFPLPVTLAKRLQYIFQQTRARESPCARAAPPSSARTAPRPRSRPRTRQTAARTRRCSCPRSCRGGVRTVVSAKAESEPCKSNCPLVS